MSPRARRRARVAAKALALAVVLGWSARVAEVDPAKLFDRKSARAVSDFALDMFPPDVSTPFLATVALAVARTLAIALAGSTLAVLLALPLGYLATPTLFRRGVLLDGEPQTLGRRALALLSSSTRGLLRFLRAVPDVMWGVLFVVAVGLGPLAGTLALGVCYAGVLGRVYADVFEATDPRPLEALHATGASRFAIFAVGIWPQARASVVAYTLYSFECCVRAASVLGFIGAGGIGYEISVSMRLFDYHQVTTLLGAYLAVVFASEALSRALRGRFAPLSRSIARGVGVRAALAGAFLIAVLVSFAGVGALDADLRGAGGRALRFASSLWPPDTSRGFLVSLGVPLLQTLAIGVTGTAIGIVVGGALTIPSVLATIARHGDDRAPVLGALAAAGRAGLALLRSIPEMLWVLLCILAIGLGPFAGTLAVGLHTAGVLGKLYADALEEVSPGPADALYASGASVAARLLWAGLPEAWPALTSFTLLRFEANLRAATVVGLVGGGGIGLALYNDIQLGFYDRVGTLIALVYGLVAASDWLTDRLRRGSAGRSAPRVADAPSTALLATGDALAARE